MTTILTPGFDPERLRAFTRDCCGVILGSGIGELTGQAFRIAHMGYANAPMVLGTLGATEVALRALGLPHREGGVQAAIAAGDEVTGATTFRIEPSLDSGPVYGVVTEAVRPTDTAGDLLDRLSVSGAVLLERTLDGIADGSLTAVPQPVEGVTIAPKITVEEARVRWDLPAQVVDRRIRAVTPNPGAWTMIGDLRVKVGPVTPVEADPLPPGVIHVDREGVRVGTASTPVLLGEIQPPGKKPMKAADWARGARLDADVTAE